MKRRQKNRTLAKLGLKISALAIFLFVGCADMFQDRVPMQLTTNGVTIAKLFETEETIETLDAPKQIFVTNGEYNDHIIISWKKVKGARSYSIERAISTERDVDGSWKIPDESAFEPLPHSSFIEGTEFTDTIIEESEDLIRYDNEAFQCGFFYRICAKNDIENYGESAWYPDYYKVDEKGNPVPETDRDPPAVGSLLAPPSGLKATCGKYQDKIVLSWAVAPSSVSKYIVYSSLNSDGSGASPVAGDALYGNATSCTIPIAPDQKGKNFYFTIKSVGSNNNMSVSSSVALGYALKPGAPGSADEIRVTKGRGDATGQITLEWDEVAGATKYRLYRYTSADATLRQSGSDIPNASGTISVDDELSLKPNVFYYYQVQAISEIGSEEFAGAMSETGDDDEKSAEAYLLSPPQSVAVKKIQGDVNNSVIMFSAAIGDQNSVYNSPVTIKKADWKSYTYVVYASDSAENSSFTKIAEFSSPTKSTEEGIYEEKVPTKKFYKVSVWNGSEQSDMSAAIAPAPYPAKNLVVTKNAFIDGYTNNDSNANANGVHAIKLFWQAPDGGADGGYHIYRSTKPNSGFKKITESPVTDTTYIYKDEQAKAGNYYYYRVLSLNSLGQGANYTDTEYGYGALTTYQYVREYIKTTLNSQKKLTLMHKSGNTAKLGQETAQGAISGTLSYDAHVSGMSGRVIMQYTNYADFYIMNDKALGVYFLLNGNTNTSAGMDTNGTMDGTVQVQGMYPGSVSYNAIQIKGGAAGGGTYGVTRKLSKYKSDGSLDSATENITVQEDWTTGEK